MPVRKRKTYWRVQTFENDLTQFSPNAFKAYLPRVYSAAMVTIMCRIQCSGDKRVNMQNDAESGGHTFTSCKGHLYFWLM